MITITPIKAYTDNYIWAIINPENRRCALVDPGDAKPALEFLKSNELTLVTLLITHHHWDHTSGITEILKQYDVPVYGPANEDIPGKTHPLKEGDTFKIEELNLKFSILDMPGHTLGQIAFYSKPYLFSGDTLFSCGCGRLFEGTAEQLYTSLQKLAKLPGDTQVYCGHEYTLKNIEFALMVEPENQVLLAYKKLCEEKQNEGLPTLPSTIKTELECNPFLRCDQVKISGNLKQKATMPLTSPTNIFSTLRQWKDAF